MPVVAVVNRKGGSGKSTLATHLAGYCSNSSIPVMLGDAKLAQDMAAALDKRGVYVAGFFYPVVPKGRARIRTQLSAALSFEDVSKAVEAFVDAGRELKVI